MAFRVELSAIGEHVFPPSIVPFPRGFAFGRDGRLFLASGIGPNGQGDDTIVAFAPNGAVERTWAVRDPELSPLDLAIAPNDNVVVSSEHPFVRMGGAPSNRNLVSWYADGGIGIKAPFSDRPDDVLTLGIAYRRISGEAALADRQ